MSSIARMTQPNRYGGVARVSLPNRLGWVRSLSVEMNSMMEPITSWHDPSPIFDMRLATVDVNVSLTVPYTSGVASQLHRWMYEGIPGSILQEEFMCLFCKSPNIILNTHCSQCGAPRSFILG